MSFNYLLQHSSHLLVSDSATAEQQAIVALQQILCPKLGCKQCVICSQIYQKSHPWITWLEPENSYTLEQIDSVIESVQFLLDSKEKRFFIFTIAHELTSACCNRLLKTIEEPHAGYYFLFITHRPQELLPTLTSRCFTQNFKSEASEHFFHEILQPFINETLKNPLQFMKLIDKQNIKESSTKEVIDLLFQHFYEKLKSSVQNSDETSQQKYLNLIAILKKSLLQLPLQGSHKIFWKNFYLTFHLESSCSKK